MRALLLTPLLAIWFLASGCGVLPGSDPAPTPTSTPTATPTKTPTPTPTPTTTPTPTPVPELVNSYVVIAQGGYGVIEARGNATSATATFNGRTLTLFSREGGFWGVVGASADQALGVYDVTVDEYDAAGGLVGELYGSVEVVDTAYPVETITLAPDESALLDPALAEQEANTRAGIYSQSTPQQLWQGAFIQPHPGPISSPYGIGRSYNGGPVTSFHSGTDFALDEGTPVSAANAGNVVFASELPIRGLSVIIDHGGGVFSAYHHLSGTAVAVGQFVSKGDLVGYVGSSGLATGPHLHWEIIVNGVNVDPMLWTAAPVGPQG